MVKIKVKKLHEQAILPWRAHDTDAGFDIVCTKMETQGDVIKYYTGLAFEIPPGYYMAVYPRSSISKYDLALTNATGIIDASYRGEVMAVFRTTKDCPKIYEVGDRICQAIIRKIEDTTYEFVDELSDTARGTGGFGSTGG
jgi:dUTP pyrophosphatase